jgi:hypothetical protein
MVAGSLLLATARGYQESSGVGGIRVLCRARAWGFDPPLPHQTYTLNIQPPAATVTSGRRSCFWDLCRAFCTASFSGPGALSPIRPRCAKTRKQPQDSVKK